VKVNVDSNVCQGHTLRAMAAPDLFVLGDEDGHAAAASGPVPSGLEGAAREAARTCPEQAVVLS
jgi:ferredoxin